MTAIAEYVEAVRRQQRAARHTVSLVLAVHAVALVGLTIAHARIEWRFGSWFVLVPAVTYLLLWLVVRIRQSLTGMGGGHDGFGVMAAVALAVALAFPFSLVAILFAGAGTFLGIGLVVIGARMQARSLWGPGVALVVLCPLVELGTIDNHAAILGHQTGTLVLGVLSAGLALLSGRAYLVERAALGISAHP